MKETENTIESRAPDMRHTFSVISPEDRWRLYVTLYASLEPTEGVDQAKVHTFERNIRRAQRHMERLTEKRKEQLQLPEGIKDEFLSLSPPEKRTKILNQYENMTLRIIPDRYQIYFKASEEGEPELETWASRWWFRKQAHKQRESEAGPAHAPNADAQDDNKAAEGEGAHHEDDAEHALLEKFVMNAPWMKGLSRDEVDEKNQEFRAFKGEDADVSMAE